MVFYMSPQEKVQLGEKMAKSPGHGGHCV